MSVRILVADDFPPWRRFVSSLILPKMPEWHIVCNVSDGLEAVIKAQEIKPDIILLDIGLPKLNGIEAARQINKVASNSKILFVSALDSHEVVEEALNTGASGYVAKLDAGSELVGAVEAVLQGKSFLSSSLRGVNTAQTENAPVSDKPVHHKPLGCRLVQSPKKEFTRCHEVLFYSDEGVLLESITQFIGAALMFGNGAIVFATKRHRDMLLEELRAQDLDADALIQKGAFVSVDAAETFSTFMINGWPDADRFLESFKNLIESASKAAMAKHPRVAIFGEGCALLWAEGKRKAAIRLEQFGNDLAITRKVDILCAYPFNLSIREDKPSFDAICGEHSGVHLK